ncbi:MAG: tetratricopeptide repeat protein [Chitinophagaceae bacterium]
MQRLFLSFVILLSAVCARAQGNPEAQQLVNQGIELHDKGEYEAAIRKYDQAIKLDDNYFNAWYEKMYSLYEWGKKKECISIAKDVLKKFPDNPGLRHVYIQYGSSLDDIGKPEEAIEIYDKGISLYPDEYLLHFNKGLTLQRLEKNEEALLCYQQSLRLKPLHSSSNLYTGMLLQQTNKIPALLAYATFLAIEPRSGRSEDAFRRAENIMWGNIKKEGDKTTILMDASVLKAAKDKNGENDFVSVEMIFVLSGASSKELDSLTKTPVGKLSFRLQMLINSLAESKKNKKGFYWEHYVPFFIEMKKKDMVETLANLMYLKTNGEEGMKWLEENEAKVDAFYDWVKSYRW